MTQSTSPSPWMRRKHKDTDSLSLTVVGAEGYTVANVRGWSGKDGHRSADADADLIARVPELVEEVRELRAALRECADLLAEGVRMEQADRDSPPEPASRWDYEAYHVAGDARALLPETGDES